MSFRTIHTSYGLAKIAAAEASGIPINLTHMAVGDGNGNPVTVTESQTALVRDTYRSTVNRVYQDPDNPLLFTAELIVPAATGGFVVRECGIFDADGSLFAVANIPDTYKPTSSEGAYSDMVVRLQFLVSNASVITLMIDPSVAVATQTWIINNITPATLFPGGTTHQVLRKKTNADGDTEWADPSTVSVVVSILQETQTLAASQTAVTLSATTTNGLAVFIEGVKLRGDQWAPVDSTHLTLASSYPAGTKFEAVQNLPLGTTPYPLGRDNNLSDVPDKALGRTNLDVFSKAETRQLVPPGVVSLFARTTAPAGWLKANGAAISRTAYADLFAVVGTTFGAGDGFNTFNLPDLRGEFLRGWDDSRGVDAGRVMGSAQSQSIQSHSHTIFNAFAAGGAEPLNGGNGSDFNMNGNGITASTGGSETRPRNVALLACIKY